MLKAVIIGNVGQDATIKTFGNSNFVSFSVAHTEKYRDAAGVEHEKTQWVSCLKRVNEGSPLVNFIRKGTKVYVEGRLSAKVFESQVTNTPQVALNLDVSHFEFLSAKVEAQPQSSSAPVQSAGGEFPTPVVVPMAQGMPEADDENGLPF